MNRTAPLLILGFSIIASAAIGMETSLPTKPTDSEKEFLATVERAVATTNISALVALDYLPGLRPDAARALFGSFYQDMIERGCTKLTLERVDPEKATEHEDVFGEKVRESLPVRWLLSVSHPSPVPGGKMTTELRAGLFEGKIRFTHPVQSK
jgi:hypothetical protein